MLPPLVSIALCACNGEAFIEAQLRSVLAQTHRALEVVVVDDASDDRTPELVAAIAARDPRVVLHRNPKRLGVNANFARAFSLCRGAFIAPCDQDDVWSERKIDTLLRTLGNADLAYGDSAIVDAHGRPTGATLGAQRRMATGRAHASLAFDNTVSGHAMLFRRELLDHAAPFPHDVWYDWWLAFTASQCDGLAYVDEVLVAFRRHDGAQTRIGRPRANAEPNRPQRRAREAQRWLAACTALLDEASIRPWPCRAAAIDLSTALIGATAGGRTGPLWSAIVRHRAMLRGDEGTSWLRALHLGARIVRRLRRAGKHAAGSEFQPAPGHEQFQQALDRLPS